MSQHVAWYAFRKVYGLGKMLAKPFVAIRYDRDSVGAKETFTLTAYTMQHWRRQRMLPLRWAVTTQHPRAASCRYAD
jgi:hypothetical protein